MLRIHQSNRLEVLFDSLAGILATPLQNVLSKEIIIVQSQGLARWLSLRLAARFSITANILFPFPASFVNDLAGPLEDEDDRDIFSIDSDALHWAILAQLGSIPDTDSFAPIRRYLAAGGDETRAYQLARRLGHLFDRYLIHRPEWIFSWSRGEEDHWQAELWRKLMAAHGGDHRAARQARLLERIDKDFLEKTRLPERLSLFAIPSLPPVLLDVFSRLAEHMEVNYFLLNPCQVFWEDILPQRVIHRALAGNSPGREAEDLHFVEGNPLLSGFGRFGRDFQKLLYRHDFEEESRFVDPGSDTVLHAIQSDILHLRDRDDPGTAPLPADTGDISLQFHAAHGPLREVEILHDNLLRLFELVPGLEPREVLVMTPDIGIYAPLLEAVFSSPEKTGATIPYSIADRGMGTTSLVVRSFLQLLAMADDRLYCSQVMALLETQPVRDRFGISLEEMETIRNWVRIGPAHWGLDGEHRASLGLPPERIGTWLGCLDRLFLGFAMPGEAQGRFFQDILPYDHIEGDLAELLGRFASFIEVIGRAADTASRKHSLAEWRRLLFILLDEIFAADTDYENEVQTIRRVIREIEQAGQDVGFADTVPIRVILAALEEKLLESAGRGEFLTGKVTFCQMVPMRSIPFRVICMIGMNEGAFPRHDPRAEFDLMGKEHRPGDRNRRDDDLYLFLEALLSARDVLYLSFVGQDEHDNTRLPPSIAVSELLSHAAEALGKDPEQGKNGLVVYHPLQPFSRRYFSGEENLSSYSAVNRAIAGNIGAGKEYGGLFYGEPVMVAEPQPVEVSESELIAFFQNPVRHLLRRRYGLRLEDRDDSLDDREKFSLDSLARYQMIDSLVAESLRGGPVRDKEKILRAQGALPHGAQGRFIFKDARQEADGLGAEIRKRVRDAPALSLSIRIERDGLCLAARIDAVYPFGQLLYRSGLKKKRSCGDIVLHWIRHLLYNAAEERPGSGATLFLYRDGLVRYEPIVDARRELEALLDLHELGLSAPLLLFPRASLQYAKALWAGGRKKGKTSAQTEEIALEKASAAWHEGDYFSGPEKKSPYFRAAFGDRDPLNDPPPWPVPSFTETAARVLQKAITSASEE